MKVGAEDPKKVAAAGVLLLGAAYAMYTQVLAPTDEPAYQRPALPAAPAPLKATETIKSAQESAAARGADPKPAAKKKTSAFGEWVPTLKPKKPEDRPDPAKVNPALRTDLLAKVQGVEAAGGGRNLFEFGLAPKPIDDVKIALGQKKGGGTKGGGGANGIDAGKPPEAAKPGEAPKPQAPPVPLKYYGYVAGSARRQAFFLNGEDIFAVSEGQTVQSRYRIIRFDDNGATVEDLQFKSRQTVKLEVPPNT